jgi:hypothetical protein
MLHALFENIFHLLICLLKNKSQNTLRQNFLLVGDN